MEQIENKKKVKKAMILAGGLGTRFLPSTLAVAKELVSIGNKPILMYHLEDLAKAGITDVLIVGNKLKEESFKNFINPPKSYLDKIERDGKLGMLADYNELMSKINISYVNQDSEENVIDGAICKNELCKEKGSSIAIYAGKHWAKDDPFLVINGDDLTVYDDDKSSAQELIDVYQATGDWVMYGREVDRNLIYKYSSMTIGDRVSEHGVKMLEITEKPEKGTEKSNIMGFAKYLYTSDIFDRIKTSKPRANGEYCVVDIYSDLAKEGRVSAAIFDGNYFDCGSFDGYALANLYYGLKNKNVSEQVRNGAEDILDKFFD